MTRFWFTLVAILLFHQPAPARETIRLANNPALSPDGTRLAFDWAGDIWVASSAGGEARQLTVHTGKDAQPKFSPDGNEIAFVSDREGGPQVFVMPAQEGTPQQLTFHSSGCTLCEWTPDGNLLVEATRDHYWRHGERLFIVRRHERAAEQLVFDDYGTDGACAPDGKRLLFTREGEAWWRKGYTGARVTQVWLFDKNDGRFSKVLHESFGSRWPLWKPDGAGFWFVGEHARGSNLCAYDLSTKQTQPLTKFTTDSVVFPCAARNGSLLVFRHLFDLYSLVPSTGEMKKLDLWHNADRAAKKTDRRMLTSASAAAFTPDGLEVVFSAGGDLWVMDTELREPKQVTKTASDEHAPVFTPGGQAILFAGGQADQFAIWKATRADPKQYWWRSKGFTLTKLVDGKEPFARLKLSPDGTKLAYVQGRGDLCIAAVVSSADFADSTDLKKREKAETKPRDERSESRGSAPADALSTPLPQSVKSVDDLTLKNPRTLRRGWNAPDFDWSPDGKWLIYGVSDNDFNRDVWLLPTDGKGTPFNLSRHPFNEGDPVWSPDGKLVAFAGRRAAGEPSAHVCIVWLRSEDDERTAYDRKLDKALDKMKGRGGLGKTPGKDDAKDLIVKKAAPVVVDFDGLHERVRRIDLGEGSANTLFWSPDSKKLAFTGRFENKTATFAIDIGDTLTPKELTATTGTQPVWLRQGNQIVWLVGGIPTSTAATGAASAAPAPTTPTPGPAFTPKKKGFGFGGGGAQGGAPAAPATGGSYTFAVRQDLDLPARHAAVFDDAWRIMRDNWYDGRLGNNDWNAVRAKYRPVAEQAPDLDTVATLIQLMLGELNGSHLGFSLGLGAIPGRELPTGGPVRDSTAHLGLRFDPAFAGPGLKVRDVLPGGPADKQRSRVKPGEIILTIDGTPVRRDFDLTLVLNGPAGRDIILGVQGHDGAARDVTLKPITYASAQQMLYEHWLRHNRKLVADASQGKLGYLHISAMSMPTFRKFEEELVSQGSGKEGLIIDVRENGGGSTADHLLTALTQPVHAIAVPRGGGPGYPQDRKVYTTWNKPIAVLCNQNSYSNAEIFSHAVKTLGRGQVIGIPTAGAVISAGAAAVMDVGTLRLPFRGWFLVGSGEDMELHGAVPHHVLWPEIGDLPQGRDAQLAKAIEVLRGDVARWQQRGQATLKRATDR